MLFNRIMSFILDYIIIGFTVFYTLEPFYPVKERFEAEGWITHISEIIFLIYLIISLMIFKKTIGMKLLKLKLETEECIIKVVILRIILMPLNIIFYPITKKYLQDEISNSKIISEKRKEEENKI